MLDAIKAHKKATVLIFSVNIVVSFYFRRNLFLKIEELKRRILTKIVDYGLASPVTPTHQLRMAFRDTSLPEVGSGDPSHTHPISAAWRSITTTLAQYIALKSGLKTFVYQASPADVRDGLPYSREYHWVKDVLVPSSFAVPGPQDLLVIVDVDYYVDMPHLMLTHNNPILLYCFQPHAVAHSGGEFSFRFDADSKVNYNVSGGANYTHSVWNYGNDVITVSDWWTTRSYIVERRAANEHHEYILLVPAGTWKGLFSLFARALSSNALDYLKVNHGQFSLLDSQNKDGVTRSVARLGDYNVATIDVKTFDALVSVNRNSKLDIGNATVQSWVDDKHQAVVLVDYLKTKQVDRPVLIYPPSEGVRKYQIYQDKKEIQIDDDEAIMVPFMSPLIPNTFVPTKSFFNERASVFGRVFAPADDARMLAKKYDVKMVAAYIEEFVELLIPKAHTGDPVDVEDVYERMDRPTQRALLNQADMVNEPDRKSVAFMKAEPYQKATDPRMIATFNSTDIREFQRFIYPLTKEIAKLFWYAFGKNPRQIATMVVDICVNSKKRKVNCSDANRMDGHVNEVCRMLERAILLRFFKVRYQSKLIDVHGAFYKLPARTRLGMVYDIDFNRGSGEPATAVFNTIITKFGDYIARRLEGETPIDAYNVYGIFGGDDSLTEGFFDNTIIERANAMIGQSVENVVFKEDSLGVNFLSRFFSEMVWHGDDASWCDLPRALGKLHVTPNLTGFSRIDKLKQKLQGLYLTDAMTPILTEVLQTAVRLGMNVNVDQKLLDPRIVSWWAHWPDSENWPNVFPKDPYAYVTHMFNFVNVDTGPLFNYLEKATAREDLLSMPA